MFRKTLKLKQNELILKLPKELVGEDVEVLVLRAKSVKEIEVIDKKTEDKKQSLKEKLKNLNSSLQIDNEKKDDKELSQKEIDEQNIKIQEEHLKELEEKKKAEEERKRREEEERKAEEERNKIHGKALVVDDNELNQKLVCKVLNDIGLDIDTAPNGFIALRKRKAQEFDIIFMDVEMPIMNGIEATKNIRKYELDKSLNQVPIVAFTANPSAANKALCIKEGMNEYMPKPIKKANLRSVIESFLGSPQQIEEERLAEEKKLAEKMELKKQKTKEEVKTKEESKKIKHSIEPDVLVFRKKSIETNIAKSVIRQLDVRCDTCKNMDDFEKKLNENYYKLLIFDYEAKGMDIKRVLEFKKEIEQKNEDNEINLVMIADFASDLTSINENDFTKIIKGLFGRNQLEFVIRKYCKGEEIEEIIEEDDDEEE